MARMTVAKAWADLIALGVLERLPPLPHRVNPDGTRKGRRNPPSCFRVTV